MHDGKIWITDWSGNRHEMTPIEFFERIKEDSASNWNWLAPATEIARTISDSEFPEPIANELKGIVLRCFADLLLAEQPGYQKNTDQIAVAYCYYSIHGKAGKRVKRQYRENLLRSVVAESPWHKLLGACGEEWRKFCETWKKDALQYFTERFGVDFMRFRANAKADFKKAIELADEAGEFENDKVEYEKGIKEIVHLVADF